MRKIILSMPGCSRCKALATLYPEAEVIELDPATLMALGKATNIKMLPMVLLSGEIEELAKQLKAGE